jgi:hypothetical protein
MFQVLESKSKEMLVEIFIKLFQKKNIVTKDLKASNFKAIEVNHKEQ